MVIGLLENEIDGTERMRDTESERWGRERDRQREREMGERERQGERGGVRVEMTVKQANRHKMLKSHNVGDVREIERGGWGSEMTK